MTATAFCMRRISVARNCPLAPPQASPDSLASAGLRTPAVHGSRRAQPGYSTGGAGGWRFWFETSSTAVSSVPPSGDTSSTVESCGAAAGFAGWLAGAGLPTGGCGGAVCWATAGSARTIAADAISRSLVRIASLRDRHLNLVGRLLPGQSREEIEAADYDHGDDDEHERARHGPAFAEQESRCIAPE